jgi:sulfite reductase (ferredoxin)
LPRKFKISFSGSKRDRALATVNDLGFIAKKREGKEGFAVYIAGGMGRRSRVGQKLYNFIGGSEVYNIVKAAKNLFDRYGNRRNKHAARLRFLLERLGKEQFVEKFEEELAKVRNQKYPPLVLVEAPGAHAGCVEVPLFLGDMTASRAKKLAKIMARYGDGSIRVTQEQNLLLRNIPEDDLQDLKAELSSEGILEALPLIIGKAVACAGASTCKLGFCLSRNLLKAIRDEVGETVLSNDKLDDVRLRISGCPNSCGHHIIADIGLFGAVRRKDNHVLPVYNLVAGGAIAEGKSRLAEGISSLPAKSIPKCLREFFCFVNETRASEEQFSDYLDRLGKEKLKEIANRCSAIPLYEEHPEYYKDWHSDEPFSLVKRVEGECSAGLFDLIELDLRQAEDGITSALETADKSEAGRLIADAVVSAARALLITKGFEPETDRESVALFLAHFAAKHIDERHTSTLNKYLLREDIAPGDAQEFLGAVKALYAAMDDSLRFPDVGEGSLQISEAPQEDVGQQESTPGKAFRDFRGVACPLNFVKTKLVLETMKTAAVLEVLLDDGEPIENVPPSVRAEGHEVLSVRKVNGSWSVIIRKREAER